MSKRSVDALESELRGQAVVLRIDATEPVGRDVARRYGLAATPTFIVFDAVGRQHYRASGFPDTDALREAVRGAS